MARPLELNKGSRFVILASICIVVGALYFAQTVLIPLALALMLSFLLNPLVRVLERRRLGRIPSVIIVTLTMLGLVALLGWIVVTQVLNLAKNLPQYQENIVRHVSEIRGKPGGTVDQISENVAKLAEQLEKSTPATKPATAPASQPAATQPTTPQEYFAQFMAELKRRDDDAADPNRRKPPPEAKPVDVPGGDPKHPVYTQVVPPTPSPMQRLAENLDVLTEPLGTAGLVLLLVMFMLLQREDLRDRVIRLVGQGQIHITTTALDDAGTRISRYLSAMAIVNGTYGVAIAIGLWLIGKAFGGGVAFPSVVLWGLLCAVLRFIPYIGPWIAAAFPIALSFAVYESYMPFFATLGMFVVVELFSNNVMEPMLYGSSTGMSTLAIIVAAVFWTWLWGPIGLLLATPLTVCLVVIGKYVPQLQFLDILLGDEPVLEPPARVYQRLLALDQEEATELARAHLRETSLESVYDELLLPALSMAEQDRHKGNLNEDREAFIMQAMRGMIDELGDLAREIEEKQASTDLRDAAAANVAIAKGEAPAPASMTASTPPITPAKSGPGPLPAVSGAAIVGGLPAKVSNGMRSMVPNGCLINVVCLPARDEGDEIANLMLAQLLAFHGYCSHAIPVAALAGEMMEAVASKQADVVAISALPPGAVSYSRYLCKRLHAKYPTITMAVGLWTWKGDLKKAKERITCAASVNLGTTFASMLEVIHQMAQPAILRAEADREKEKTGSLK